ncbi:MAG: type II toxin-antitoxin system VapB family antitoxin [Dermatophilaceae bacterium]|jgi:antitoxin VapB|nr:type II toxin-antitoxin system VapB family antitoxin [Actinomycetales bacterium]MBP8881837.1 type II toxin-antitoxin system VapB family antitoxin [Dermatophilaceae bacterium]MBP9918237.1 type II toxin-antitoxin system VapB family antitoxin [Dermatophilaceae bacterium]
MALNIKNERVCRLAKQAAELTGRSQVSVLEEALEAYLAQHDARAAAARRLERVNATLARIDARMTDADRAQIQRHMDEMYDENGLPA